MLRLTRIERLDRIEMKLIEAILSLIEAKELAESAPYLTLTQLIAIAEVESKKARLRAAELRSSPEE